MVKKHRKSRKNTRRKNVGAKNNIRRKTKKRRSRNSRSKNMKRRPTRKSVVRSKTVVRSKRRKKNMKGGWWPWEPKVQSHAVHPRVVVMVEDRVGGGELFPTGAIFSKLFLNRENKEVARIYQPHDSGEIKWEEPVAWKGGVGEGFSVNIIAGDLVGWNMTEVAKLWDEGGRPLADQPPITHRFTLKWIEWDRDNHNTLHYDTMRNVEEEGVKLKTIDDYKAPLYEFVTETLKTTRVKIGRLDVNVSRVYEDEDEGTIKIAFKYDRDGEEHNHNLFDESVLIGEEEEHSGALYRAGADRRETLQRLMDKYIMKCRRRIDLAKSVSSQSSRDKKEEKQKRLNLLQQIAVMGRGIPVYSIFARTIDIKAVRDLEMEHHFKELERSLVELVGRGSWRRRHRAHEKILGMYGWERPEPEREPVHHIPGGAMEAAPPILDTSLPALAEAEAAAAEPAEAAKAAAWSDAEAEAWAEAEADAEAAMWAEAETAARAEEEAAAGAEEEAEEEAEEAEEEAEEAEEEAEEAEEEAEEVAMAEHEQAQAKKGVTAAAPPVGVAGSPASASEPGSPRSSVGGDATGGGVARANVTFEYEASEPGDITIAVGDVVVVSDKSDADWWAGHVEGKPDKVGFFPASFVEIIR